MEESEIKTYKAQEVVGERKKLIGQPIVIRGVPTGLYADRVSYGNRPTLAIVLDGVLPCQAFCSQYSWKNFQPQTARLLAELSDRYHDDLDDLTMPETNNEYLAVAAAVLDDSIRRGKKIDLVGMVREDGIFGFGNLTVPGLYRFVFIPKEE